MKEIDLAHYTISLKRAAEDDRKFYGWVGPFLGSREVRKELGGFPINNEPDWPWLIVLDKQAHFRAVGFASLEPRSKAGWWLHECYVIPDVRHQGIGSALIRKAQTVAAYEGVTVLETKVLDTAAEWIQAIDAGWTIIKQNGNWVTLRGHWDAPSSSSISAGA